MLVERFKTQFAKNIFQNKYAQGPNDSWDALADRVVSEVCGSGRGAEHPLLSRDDQQALAECIKRQTFIPGGRYLYYAGRPARYYNNCFLLRAEEDTREEWANIVWRSMSCLTVGGGIGIDYSRLRASGRPLKRTGGLASGPLPLMHSVNEIGRNVMQGGSRRSAIYASLNWRHEDIPQFMRAKNWDGARIESLGVSLGDLKRASFNFPAPLDMTNISINYDDAWLCSQDAATNPVFVENVRQAMMTGEPGFSFNFGDKENETLRNALTSTSALH